MRIKYRKLTEQANPPYKKHPTDAGFDLTAISKKVVEEEGYGYIEYGTGLAFEIPKGYCGLIYPRSSVSKTGLILANSVGVIDSDYRGEVSFRFKYVPGSASYDIGDRIGQLVVTKVPKVDFVVSEELSGTERGEGGYGSTGK